MMQFNHHHHQVQSPTSPNNNSSSSASTNRVWFEFKGKLDCIKSSGNNLEYITDLKQAIHKKLGHTLSATALDLELYLQFFSDSDDHNGEKNFRQLTPDMPCDFCYGVNLFKITGASNHRVVVLNMPVARNNNNNNNNVETIQSQKPSSTPSSGKNNNRHHTVTDSEYSRFVDEEGIINDDDDDGVNTDHGTAATLNGGFRSFSRNSNATTSLQSNNPRNSRILSKNDHNNNNHFDQNPNKIICIGIDVAQASDTKSIIGSITMELPLSEIQIRQQNADMNKKSIASSSSSSTSPLFFNQYILDRARDAIEKNVALAGSRAFTPRLARIMMYDSDFSEFVLFSENTNPGSFPIYSSFDSQSGKLIGRPSLLGVVDFVPGTAENIKKAGFVITSPLYIAAILPPPPPAAPQRASLFLIESRNSNASGDSIQANNNNNNFRNNNANSIIPAVRPSSAKIPNSNNSVHFVDSHVNLDHQRPWSAATVSRNVTSGLTKLPKNNQNNNNDEGDNNHNNNTSTMQGMMGNSMNSSLPRCQKDSEDTTSVNYMRPNYSHNSNPPAPATANQRSLSLGGVGALPPSPAPENSNQKQIPFSLSHAEDQNQNLVQKTSSLSKNSNENNVDALVFRLGKVTTQLKEEKDKTRDLRQLLIENEQQHQKDIEKIIKQAEEKFQQDQEERMQELNANLDGNIQNLQEELNRLRQEKLERFAFCSPDEVIKLRRQVAEIEAENDSMQKKKNALEAHLELTAKNFEKVKAEKEEYKRKYKAEATERIALQQEVDNAMAHVGAMREMTVLRLKVEEYEESIGMLQREKSNLLKEFQESRDFRILAEKRAEVVEHEFDGFRDHWSKENTEKTRRIADLQEKLQLFSNSHSESAITAIAATRELETAKLEIDGLRTKILELTLRLEAEQKRCEQLTHEKMQLQIDDSFRAKAIDLTRQNMGLMQERDKLKQKVWELEKDFNESKMQLQVAKSKYNTQTEVKMQNETAHSTNTRQLLEENAELQAKLSSCLESENSAKTAFERVKIELEDAYSKHGASDERLKTRQKELEQEVVTLKEELSKREEMLAVGREDQHGALKRHLSDMKNREIKRSEENQEKMDQLRKEYEDKYLRDTDRTSTEWRNKLDELNIQLERSNMKNLDVARENRELRRKLDDLEAEMKKMRENPVSKPVATNSDDASDVRSMNVLLKLQKAVSGSAREEQKKVIATQSKDLAVKDQKLIQEQRRVHESQRENFFKTETVGRLKIQEEFSVSTNQLQKVFEDQVLQHISNLGEDFALEDTFVLDESENNDDDDEISTASEDDVEKKEPVIQQIKSSAPQPPAQDQDHLLFQLQRPNSVLSDTGFNLSASDQPNNNNNNNLNWSESPQTGSINANNSPKRKKSVKIMTSEDEVRKHPHQQRQQQGGDNDAITNVSDFGEHVTTSHGGKTSNTSSEEQKTPAMAGFDAIDASHPAKHDSSNEGGNSSAPTAAQRKALGRRGKSFNPEMPEGWQEWSHFSVSEDGEASMTKSMMGSMARARSVRITTPTEDEKKQGNPNAATTSHVQQQQQEHQSTQRHPTSSLTKKEESPPPPPPPPVKNVPQPKQPPQQQLQSKSGIKAASAFFEDTDDSELTDDNLSRGKITPKPSIAGGKAAAAKKKAPAEDDDEISDFSFSSDI